MEKMSIKKQTEVRANVYEVIASALANAGYSSEMITEGRLVDLGDGYFGKVKFSVCDATKFSLETERENFAKKTAEAAERAEKARIKAEEKEAKALERAAKAAEKAE